MLLLLTKFILSLSLIFGGPVAQPSFEAFMWAISEQESGGQSDPYSVVNAYGAVGKYQVLKSNVPGWSKKVLGYSITWQKFRDSPDLQEKIVRGILKGYYNKYGARGAASAWYSGNPNLDQSTRSQSGGPSIKSYVDSVIKKAGGYTGSSSSSSSSYSSTEVSRLSGDELAEQYGFVAGLLNSNPELKKLFAKATSGQWTTEKFQAELRDTKWWKSHSSEEREFLVLKFGDPKTADQKLSQSYIAIRQLAAQIGLRVDKSNVDWIRTLAYNQVAKGWTDAQLRNAIGQKIVFSQNGKMVLQGEAGEAYEKIKAYALNMGVTMSHYWIGSAARDIARGLGTEEEYQSKIREQAKALYPTWQKQIEAGQTVADIASPYLSSMQNILEIPQGSITLDDKTIKSALQNKNKVTGQSEVMPLWQFENQLRNDPRWKGTQNAQNGMMQVAHQVLADFGVAY